MRPPTFHPSLVNHHPSHCFHSLLHHHCHRPHRGPLPPQQVRRSPHGTLLPQPQTFACVVRHFELLQSLDQWRESGRPPPKKFPLPSHHMTQRTVWYTVCNSNISDTPHGPTDLRSRLKRKRSFGKDYDEGLCIVQVQLTTCWIVDLERVIEATSETSIRRIKPLDDHEFFPLRSRA